MEDRRNIEQKIIGLINTNRLIGKAILLLIMTICFTTIIVISASAEAPTMSDIKQIQYGEKTILIPENDTNASLLPANFTPPQMMERLVVLPKIGNSYSLNNDDENLIIEECLSILHNKDNSILALWKNVTLGDAIAEYDVTNQITHWIIPVMDDNNCIAVVGLTPEGDFAWLVNNIYASPIKMKEESKLMLSDYLGVNLDNNEAKLIIYNGKRYWYYDLPNEGTFLIDSFSVKSSLSNKINPKNLFELLPNKVKFLIDTYLVKSNLSDKIIHMNLTELFESCKATPDGRLGPPGAKGNTELFPDTVPYYSQINQWCGCYSTTMVLRWWGVFGIDEDTMAETIVTLAQPAKDNPPNTREGTFIGCLDWAVKHLPNEYLLDGQQSWNTWHGEFKSIWSCDDSSPYWTNDIKDMIYLGNPVIIQVDCDDNVNTIEDFHAVVLIGYNDNTNVVHLNDPSGAWMAWGGDVEASYTELETHMSTHDHKSWPNGDGFGDYDDPTGCFDWWCFNYHTHKHIGLTILPDYGSHPKPTVQLDTCPDTMIKSGTTTVKIKLNFDFWEIIKIPTSSDKTVGGIYFEVQNGNILNMDYNGVMSHLISYFDSNRNTVTPPCHYAEIGFNFNSGLLDLSPIISITVKPTNAGTMTISYRGWQYDNDDYVHCGYNYDHAELFKPRVPGHIISVTDDSAQSPISMPSPEHEIIHDPVSWDDTRWSLDYRFTWINKYSKGISVFDLGDKLCFTIFCPANMTVTDPNGRSINQTINEIPDGSYEFGDYNSDGKLDKRITILDALSGNYQVNVIPDSNANPLDTYSIQVDHNGDIYWIVQNGKIGDIPSNPYIVPIDSGDTNSPPNLPTNPSPSNGATNINTNCIFSWICSDPENDPLTYDVLFGKTYPLLQVSSGQSTNTFNPGTLNEASIYYWQIIVHDDKGHTTFGPSWSFSTPGGASESDLYVGTPHYGANNEYVTSHTPFHLPGADGNISYWYRIWDGGWSGWQSYSSPFRLSGECMHMIEYELRINGNSTGSSYTKTFYVDNSPPVSSIHIGVPYYTDGSTEWITPWTPITLSAVDGPPCGPSGVNQIKYDFSGDNQGAIIYSGSFTIEDLISNGVKYWGPQTIEYWSIDNLVNTESPHHVRTLKIVIPLDMVSDKWFLDGAYQDNSGYKILQGPSPGGLTPESLQWEINVDKSEPYDGLVPPNAFVDIYYDNQGMDWTQAESIDMIVMPTSSLRAAPSQAELSMRIDNPMTKWPHDLSTDSTKTGEIYRAITLGSPFTTYSWNPLDSSIQRDNLKSFRLHMIQSDNTYAVDGEKLTFYIKGIFVAGPIGLDSGTPHPLDDITTNTNDFKVTNIDGDWSFQHNIQNAVNWAKEGLTITVDDGVYYENVYLFRDDVTLLAKHMPIDNYSQCIIDGRQIGPALTINADDITIQGFKITNGLHGIRLITTGSNGVYITCNQIIFNKQDGIIVENGYSGVSNVQIHYNDIYASELYGVENYNVPYSIDAQWNYWGYQHLGPFYPRVDHRPPMWEWRDSVSDRVNYNEWQYVIANANGPYQFIPENNYILFDGSASSYGCGADNCDNAEFIWYFGDGETASGETHTHNYQHQGSYPVILTLTTITSCGIKHQDIDTTYVGDYDPPILMLLYPTGGEILNGMVPIQWYATDTEYNASPETLPIHLYYKAEDAAEWIQFGDTILIPNTGHYNWDTSTLKDGRYLLKIEAEDQIGTWNTVQMTSGVFTVSNGGYNADLAPYTPSRPSGSTNGKAGQEYLYTTSTTDPEGDQVYYFWDWGDGTNSGWLGPYNSGVESCEAKHTWQEKNSYNIKVKAKDSYGKESNWSDPLPITMPASFNNPFLQFWEHFLHWLFERFPNAFPMLRQLMGVL